MLLWVGMKAAVLMAVAIHRTKLIQVLRSAVRAHPGHAASDASAQTFRRQNLWATHLWNGFEPRESRYTCALSALRRVHSTAVVHVAPSRSRDESPTSCARVRMSVLAKSVRVESEPRVKHA